MKDEMSNVMRKQFARMLYTQNGDTEKVIAATVEVDEATIRAWKREGAWDGIKQSLLVSKKAQLENYYDILHKLKAKAKEETDANPKNADLIVKYTTAIKNLEADNSVCSIIEVAEQFTKWLLLRDVEFTQRVTLMFDSFIVQKLAA